MPMRGWATPAASGPSNGSPRLAGFAGSLRVATPNTTWDCSLPCTAGNPPQVPRIPSVFRNLELCFGSLTGRMYFGTVAKLLPKTLAELSAASG
jgi:hypothetical protein